MSNRDNFSYKVKKSIEIKSNAICNNPDCCINTNIQNDEGIINSIGKACHIEAASSGGPRYNSKSTSEYRKSIDNAIWLCSNCADLIDKDYKSYPPSLLKEWKSRAENINTKNSKRIFAVANPSGGVGCSSVTAFLSETFAAVSDDTVLCISSNAYNHSGAILLNFDEIAVSEMEKYDPQKIVRPLQNNIDFINDENIKSLLIDNEMIFSKNNLKKKIYKLIKDNNYKYVFIDCGNEFSNITIQLLDIATDIIVPIGEHMQTSTGINLVGDYLKTREVFVRVWPVFSLGLTMNNKEYIRNWFFDVVEAINRIRNTKNIELIDCGIIIPKNSYVNFEKKIFDNNKTRNVADGYFKLTNYLLEYTGCTTNKLK